MTEQDRSLLIRAHHAQQYGELLNLGEKLTVKKFRRLTHRSSLRDWLADPQKRELRKKYKIDVEGSKNSAKERAAKVESFVDKVSHLTDDQPVRLVVGQPDDLCATCVYGEHCGLRNVSSYGGEADTTKSDEMALGGFVAKAQGMGLGRDMKIENEVISFRDDTANVQVSYVETTVGVVKKVYDS